MMQTFSLSDEFTDPQAERSLLAALAQNPMLYWELADHLSPETFVIEPDAWTTLSQAITAEKPIQPFEEWEATKKPEDVARTLSSLHQKRILADGLQRSFEALNDPARSAHDIISLMTEEAARAQSALRDNQAEQLLWAADLLPNVLSSAESASRQRQETGKPCMGLLTGISTLDNAFNGLKAGLYILAGGPGIGKTTFAHQVATKIAQEVPVVYVTFENSPDNLVLKAVAARAQLDTKEVERGLSPVQLRTFNEAARDWVSISQRLAYVQGSPRLRMDQIRGQVMKAMNRHRSEQCLVVVDYLQLWAKSSEELRRMATVRERVETMAAELREDLAMRLKVPVVAISSMSRKPGSKSDGGYDSADMDRLKESGDLEYDADGIVFITRDDRPALPPVRSLMLSIKKNRNGENDKPIRIVFRPDTATIREEAKP
jgi:replicative DNA helicase